MHASYQLQVYCVGKGGNEHLQVQLLDIKGGKFVLSHHIWSLQGYSEFRTTIAISTNMNKKTPIKLKDIKKSSRASDPLKQCYKCKEMTLKKGASGVLLIPRLNVTHK